MSKRKSKADVFYNWNKTFNYNAFVTMVCGGRNIGKTYGMRLQNVRDYLKHGWRFVHLVRNKDNKGTYAATFFDKLVKNKEFPDYIFKTTNMLAYIAKRPKEGAKPNWKVCGYFVSIPECQDLKNYTFVNVRRIVMDEFIIESYSQQRYKHGEFEALTSLVSSASRELPPELVKELGLDYNVVKPAVYLLANPCNLVNPYFTHYHVDKIPDYGFTWIKKSEILLHYVPEDAAFTNALINDTVAGRMAKGTRQERIMRGSGYTDTSTGFISKKPSTAKLAYTFAYLNERFGVWYDEKSGFLWVCSNAPKNSGMVEFALTKADATVNRIMANRANGRMRICSECFSNGIMRFDKPATYEKFLNMLSMFGVR